MIECLMTNSTAWAKGSEAMIPQGIVIHSSGFEQPYLWYFVQPSNSDPNKIQILNTLGINQKHTDYNHTYRIMNYHYWIGKDINDDIQVIRAFPDSFKIADNYIHICLLEDDLNNKDYVIQIIPALTQLCAQLCKKHNWDDKHILDHSEVSSFPDANYWLSKYGYSSKDIRQIVKNLTK